MHTRHWMWMTHSYLGGRWGGIGGWLHSTTAPSPAGHSSSPWSAWPLAGKTLPRERHERQQGALAREVKANAFSSCAVVAAWPLAVSEGRTLRAGRLASHGWEARAWGSASPGPSLASNRLFSGPPQRTTELEDGPGGPDRQAGRGDHVSRRRTGRAGPKAGQPSRCGRAIAPVGTGSPGRVECIAYLTLIPAREGRTSTYQWCDCRF